MKPLKNYQDDQQYNKNIYIFRLVIGRIIYYILYNIHRITPPYTRQESSDDGSTNSGILTSSTGQARGAI